MLQKQGSALAPWVTSTILFYDLVCNVGNKQMLDQAIKHFKLPSSSDPLKKFMDTLFIIQVLGHYLMRLQHWLSNLKQVINCLRSSSKELLSDGVRTSRLNVLWHTARDTRECGGTPYFSHASNTLWNENQGILTLFPAAGYSSSMYEDRNWTLQTFAEWISAGKVQ